MKKDNFATPMVLHFERLTYARPFTVILRKRFILFLPYLRMDQHQLVGEKANTKSNQAEKQL